MRQLNTSSIEWDGCSMSCLQCLSTCFARAMTAVKIYGGLPRWGKWQSRLCPVIEALLWTMSSQQTQGSRVPEAWSGRYVCCLCRG